MVESFFVISDLSLPLLFFWCLFVAFQWQSAQPTPLASNVTLQVKALNTLVSTRFYFFCHSWAMISSFWAMIHGWDDAKDQDNSESNPTLREMSQLTGLQGVPSQFCPQHQLEPLATFWAFHRLANLLDCGWLHSMHAQLPWGEGTVDRRQENDQVRTKGDSAWSGGMTITSTFQGLPMALPLAHCLHLIPHLVQR